MGTMDVRQELEGDRLRAFTQRLLKDLRALETMIDEGLIETGIRRVGVEQEMFLVERSFRPAMAAMEVLERLDNPMFTTELGQFNLELNLTPCEFGGGCLRAIEEQLRRQLEQLRAVLSEMDLHAVLVGSLPTMRKSDLGLDSMAPIPRYKLLAAALDRLRGGVYDFNIKGIDELVVQHDNIMLEACNCSFQVHFQSAPDEFANLYNIAQVVAAPVVAVGANSPLLFGRRLWHETRIALFRQSIDTRRSSHHLRERSPRVIFGNGWVEDGVMDLYREDVVRFRSLLGEIHEEDPFQELAEGRVPRLRALTLHNSTVYRWNRACYGITDGKPHLRIENRVLPSGPTILDEVANAAFWFGLISYLAHEHDDIREEMDFSRVKMNFGLAARHGLDAQFRWFDGKPTPAAKLIRETLLPQAEEGLRRGGIDGEDIQRYLGAIEARVSAVQNGAQWQLDSLAAMEGQGTIGDRMSALVGAMVDRQGRVERVADWTPARIEEGSGWEHTFMRVEHYMTTDMFTVHEDESIELVANLMTWENIRHVPVEDDDHLLVGLISYRALLRVMARGIDGHGELPACASEIMTRDPITCDPDTSTLAAIRLMREHNIGSLPVVRDGQLVGIVTQQDFMDVARDLLEDRLSRLEGEGGATAADEG